MFSIQNLFHDLHSYQRKLYYASVVRKLLSSGNVRPTPTSNHRNFYLHREFQTNIYILLYIIIIYFENYIYTIYNITEDVYVCVCVCTAFVLISFTRRTYFTYVPDIVINSSKISHVMLHLGNNHTVSYVNNKYRQPLLRGTLLLMS